MCEVTKYTQTFQPIPMVAFRDNYRKLADDCPPGSIQQLLQHTRIDVAVGDAYLPWLHIHAKRLRYEGESYLAKLRYSPQLTALIHTMYIDMLAAEVTVLTEDPND